MEDLNELLEKGVEKKVISIELDMTIHTLESRISKDNFTDSELNLLKELNE
tara:strand:- start:437 stop:589 length:153 start_codon:yes stop_codon:yes gene_type:complete